MRYLILVLALCVSAFGLNLSDCSERLTYRDGQLSKEKEIELHTQAMAGDVTARNKLAESVSSAVRLIAIAYRKSGRSMTPDDLFQEGMIGAINSVARWEPSRGRSFFYYGQNAARMSMRHALTDRSRTIRLPAHMVTLLKKIRKDPAVFDTLTEARKDMVTTALNLKPSQEAHIDRAISPYEDDLEDREIIEKLFAHIRQLPQDMRAVIVSSYGLGTWEPTSMAELGREIGFTRATISVRRRAALKMLAEVMGE